MCRFGCFAPDALRHYLTCPAALGFLLGAPPVAVDDTCSPLDVLGLDTRASCAPSPADSAVLLAALSEFFHLTKLGGGLAAPRVAAKEAWSKSDPLRSGAKVRCRQRLLLDFGLDPPHPLKRHREPSSDRS